MGERLFGPVRPSTGVATGTPVGRLSVGRGPRALAAPSDGVIPTIGYRHLRGST